MARSKTRTRRARLAPERLEGRALLNGDFRYVAPDGARVHVRLLGPGTLKGTSALADGSLNLEFAATTSATRIYGSVAGGSGRARLADVQTNGVTPGDFSGAGSTPVGIVKLNQFDLIPGGVMNLSAGFSRLLLGSTAANSQLQLQATAQTRVVVTSNQNGSVSAVSTGISGSSSSTGQSSSITGSLTNSGAGGVGGLGSGAIGASGSGTAGGGGGANVSGIPGTIVGTNVGGITSTVVTGTGSSLNNSSNVTVSSNGSGGSTVTGVGSNGVVGSTSTSAGVTGSGNTTTIGITAAVVQIGHVDGAPHPGAPLGDPQIFGYDPTANTLIRFNARTGAALQTIPLAGLGKGTAVAGVALGRDDGELVALVGFNASVEAFDAITGAPVGAFGLASLAKAGLTTVDGIGSTNTATFVSDSAAGALGLIQQIDVTKSLASGMAVAVGTPFAPTRGFGLSGGLTGLAGTAAIYATGAASFDTFQPAQTQQGLLVLNATGITPLAEVARILLPGPPGGIVVGPPGTAQKNPTNALGSIESDLALVTGVVNKKNTVNLYTANGTADGIVPLADPNRLAGLSESFHPEIAGSSLINIQGSIRRFNARDARGMVLNISGRADLVLIPGPVSDSAIVGRPAAHVATGPRSNVVVLSTPRINGNKGDVVTDQTPRPLGPLALP